MPQQHEFHLASLFGTTEESLCPNTVTQDLEPGAQFDAHGSPRFILSTTTAAASNPADEFRPKLLSILVANGGAAAAAAAATEATEAQNQGLFLLAGHSKTCDVHVLLEHESMQCMANPRWTLPNATITTNGSAVGGRLVVSLGTVTQPMLVDTRCFEIIEGHCIFCDEVHWEFA
ncbi:hypothetical protein ACA910_018986 [Epithemia clementina (nom. ined.)]